MFDSTCQTEQSTMLRFIVALRHFNHCSSVLCGFAAAQSETECVAL